MNHRPTLSCIVCGEPVVLRSEPGRVRRSDASWSIAMNGWVCFGCQGEAEPLQDAVASCDEDTSPNFDPDWPES